MDAGAHHASTVVKPLSDALRPFVAENPIDRQPILNLTLAASCAVGSGAHALDVGAGGAPYRELFAHARYPTDDRALLPYESVIRFDYVGPGQRLPVADNTFDRVLHTSDDVR